MKHDLIFTLTVSGDLLSEHLAGMDPTSTCEMTDISWEDVLWCLVAPGPDRDRKIRELLRLKIDYVYHDDAMRDAFISLIVKYGMGKVEWTISPPPVPEPEKEDESPVTPEDMI